MKKRGSCDVAKKLSDGVSALKSPLDTSVAAAKEASWSYGLRGDLGGTGGGTRLEEPEGRSQSTAGILRVSELRPQPEFCSIIEAAAAAAASLSRKTVLSSKVTIAALAVCCIGDCEEEGGCKGDWGCWGCFSGSPQEALASSLLFSSRLLLCAAAAAAKSLLDLSETPIAAAPRSWPNSRLQKLTIQCHINPSPSPKPPLTHGLWKSQKMSHSTLRAKRATFTFWLDKSSLKMPKIGQFDEFLVENAKMNKFKLDILGDFQTMW